MAGNRTTPLIKRLTILAAVLVGLAAIFATLELMNVTNLVGSKSDTNQSNDSDRKINYDPPTKQEQQAGDTQKENIKDETTPTPPSNANVILVDASQYGNEVEVRAIVTNAIKDGTCTVTLKNGQSTVSESVNAFRDATTTQCKAATFERSQFTTAGTWQVTVRYTADQLAGETTGSLEIK